MCESMNKKFSKPICLPHAFTLIELLVVVAIISLLVSILLPSLNTARDLAKSVICQTNQRNIGVQSLIYSEEYGGVVLPYYRPFSTTWPGLLLELEGITPAQVVAAYTENSVAFPLYYCPYLANLGSPFTGNSQIPSGYYSNYSANMSVMGSPGGTPLQYNYYSNISRTADTGLLWDTRSRINGTRSVGATAWYHLISGNLNDSVGYVHGSSVDSDWYGGRTNVLFLDAHVDSIEDPGEGKYLPIARKSLYDLWE